MKKRLIALMAAVCLAMAPMSVLAEETEATDYSYLEDMSVKELKALRDAINKILGDEGGSDEAITEFPEEDENGYKLDVNENPYKLAIKCVNSIKQATYNPYSFEVFNVRYADDGEYINIGVDYSAASKGGTSLRKAMTLVFKENLELYTDIDQMVPYGDDLNIDFIKANMIE